MPDDIENIDRQLRTDIKERAEPFLEYLGGDQRSALDNLFSAAFEELHRVALRARRSRQNAAVSTGTLINAAWLRLVSARKFAPESKEHFYNIAAKVMRQILVEAARRKSAVKRGGKDPVPLVAFDLDTLPTACEADVLALDAALHELERVSPRQARVVEERFFGGFEMEEIAARLDVSVSTVTRDWRAARARLLIAMRPEVSSEKSAIP